MAAANRWSDVRRILVVKWSALGDVAIATACMDDLRRAFPAAVMHLNTMPSALPFFTDDARFDAVSAIDVRQRGRKLARTREWLRHVRRGEYDLVVDLQRNDHTRILLALLQLSGHRIPHRWGSRGGFPYTLATRVLPKDASARMQQVELLRAAGLAVTADRPMFAIAAAQRDAATDVLRRHGLADARFVVFLPGSQAGGWLKRWGVQRYVALGLRLLAAGVERVAVIGGPDEVDVCADIVAAVDAVVPGAAVNLNMLPLLQIVPVCERAAHVVANDTGNAHIAAAADRPLTVLCGPTDPRRVKPVGPNVRALQADVACLNCYAKVCRHAVAPRCMAALSPEAVAMSILGGGVPEGLRVF